MKRLLAARAATLGLLAAVYPDRSNLDVQRLANAVAREQDHVTANELAQWIHSRKPGLRIIDLRSADEFAKFHLPNAERIAIEALPSKQFRQDDTLVLISEAGGHAAQAWVFLQALGNRNVYFLRGGIDEWIDRDEREMRRRGC
jgi:rhodanese-related sulfurtransferase